MNSVQSAGVRAAAVRILSTRKRRHSCTVKSLFLSQEDKPQSHRTVREISLRRGIHWSSVSQIIHKDLRLKCYKKRRTQQLTEAHSMHALFSVCSLRDNNVITSKPTWKLKHTNYSRVLWIFLPNIIKINGYNFELYCCKVGHFLRHNVMCFDTGPSVPSVIVTRHKEWHVHHYKQHVTWRDLLVSHCLSVLSCHCVSISCVLRDDDSHLAVDLCLVTGFAGANVSWITAHKPTQLKYHCLFHATTCNSLLDH